MQNDDYTRLPGEQHGGPTVCFHVDGDSGMVRQGNRNYTLYPTHVLARNLTDMDINDDCEYTIPRNITKRFADSYFDIIEGEAIRNQMYSTMGCSALPGGSKTPFFEIFSPAELAKQADDFGIAMFHVGASFCVVKGCHARSADDDESFWQRLCAGDPRFCLIERGREAFSRLIKSDWGKLNPKKMQKVHDEGMGGFHFDVEVAFDTVRRGRGFALEQPPSRCVWLACCYTQTAGLRGRLVGSPIMRASSKRSPDCSVLADMLMYPSLSHFSTSSAMAPTCR